MRIPTLTLKKSEGGTAKVYKIDRIIPIYGKLTPIAAAAANIIPQLIW
jgi:hypothetical protein